MRPSPDALQVFYGTLPLLAAILLAAWNNNKRLDDLSTSLHKRLDDLQKSFESRFSSIDSRLDRVESRLSTLEQSRLVR